MVFNQKKISLPWSNEEIDLDAHLERILKIHFHAEHGAPYWINWQKKHDINVPGEVHEIQDLLNIFSEPFDETILRELPINMFMPQRIDDEMINKSDFMIGESGGSSGPPKRILNHWKSFKRSAAFLDWVMDKHGFARGESFTYIGPTGPHLFGALVREVAHLRNGLFFCIDLDSRYIKHVIRKDKREHLDEYLVALKSQYQKIFETQELGILITTSVVLDRLIDQFDIEKLGFKGVVHGGTSISPDQQETLLDIYQKPFLGIYGNSLVGISVQRPQETDTDIVYYPQLPKNVCWVGDFDQPLESQVKYGELGRICFIRLDESMFIPPCVERDQALRARGTDGFLSWDGLQDIEIVSDLKEEFTTGVY